MARHLPGVPNPRRAALPPTGLQRAAADEPPPKARRQRAPWAATASHGYIEAASTCDEKEGAAAARAHRAEAAKAPTSSMGAGGFGDGITGGIVSVSGEKLKHVGLDAKPPTAIAAHV
eukprot:scaffold12171_cov61-Phaeocystis_antarctica.AAC.4